MKSKSSKVSAQPVNADINQNMYSNPKWDNSLAMEFQNAFTLGEVAYVKTLIANTGNNADIDDICNKINNIMKEPAKQFKMIREYKKKKKKGDHVIHKDRDWFDQHCALVKREYYRAKKVYKKCKTNENLSHYNSKRKDFKKQCRVAKKKFRKDMEKTIEKLEKCYKAQRLLEKDD